MPERRFIITPWIWTIDPALNAVSEEAELLFRRLAQHVDYEWRMSVDSENPAQTIRCRCFEPQRRFRQWSPDRITRCLNQLLAAGCVARLSIDGRLWLEIAERLRYVRGRNPTALPSAEQSDLPLQAEMYALPPPGVEMRNAECGMRRNGAGNSNNTSKRKESETSTRSGINRAPSARCNREEELMAELAKIVPPSEMIRNGGIWRERIRLNARAMAYAIEAWKVRTPAQRGEIRSIGAWLTDQHERAVKEINSSKSEATGRI